MPEDEAASPTRANGMPQTAEEDAAPTVRRSGRTRRPPTIPIENDGSDAESKKSPTDRLPRQGEAPGRNTRRKTAPRVCDTPESLLEESLAPIRPDEQYEPHSWIELESDPAFFNEIIRDLGVQDAKVMELFSIDEQSLALLPEPVYGLIFLYQYVDDGTTEATEGDANVWFANQTTDNACATVALLNIIMNACDIELGDMLKDFKSKSKDLSPPLRGHLLSKNSAIRAVHNSFARRLDLLNADLSMEGEIRDFKKKRVKAPTITRKRKKPASDAAFHFIAYVPVDGKVWQLNGLDSHPVCIGPYQDHHWMVVARPPIEERMQMCGLMTFNLLAVCQRPTRALRQRLIANVQASNILEPKVKVLSEEEEELDIEGLGMEPALDLASFGLSQNELESSPVVHPPHILTDQINDPGLDLTKARHLRRKIAEELKRLCAEFQAERVAEEEDVMKASGRKKDYTAAIHEWVTRLVEHGVLQELSEETDAHAL